MDTGEHDVPVCMTFPRQHRKKLHSTNPIARLDKEVKRRADVVVIVPNEASIARPVGAGLFEQNDEWQTARGYIEVEVFARKRSIENRPHSQHRSHSTVTSGHQTTPH